jgi:spore germination protein KB
VTGVTSERISLTQVMMLMVISRLSLTLVYFGTPPGIRQDVWWQSFFAALTGLLFLWVFDRIWRRFPTQTLFQVAEAVLGRSLGRLVSFLYLLFFLVNLSLNLRLVGEFFLYAFLPRTPIIVIIGIVTALAAWASHEGIEVIGRAGQVVFPLLIGSILLIVGLLAKDIKLHLLLPPVILYTGPLPHLQDMISVAARTVEFAWLGLLVPSVGDPRRLFGAAVRAQIWQGAVWVVMSIAIIGVLGRAIEEHYFPFFAAARMVHVADFLERIDSVFLAVWLFGMYLRLAVLLWSTALSTAQCLGLQSYRPLVLPIAGIAVSYSIAQARTFSELRGYLAPEIFTPFGLLFVFVFPVLLLGVAVVRRMRGAPPPWIPPIEPSATPPT